MCLYCPSTITHYSSILLSQATNTVNGILTFKVNLLIKGIDQQDYKVTRSGAQIMFIIQVV